MPWRPCNGAPQDKQVTVFSCALSFRGGRGSCAGQDLDDAESGNAVTQVFGPAQKGEYVFNVSRLKKLQAAEFDEWDIAPGQFDFERAAVVWAFAVYSTFSSRFIKSSFIKSPHA
jgi:hypothetical protein